MNKKLALLFALVLIAAPIAYAQGQDDTDSTTTGSSSDDTVQGQDQQSQQDMYRTNLVGCILLSRHDFSGHQEKMTEILKDKTNGKDIYNKMLGEYMYNCFGHIKIDESKQILNEISNKEFEISKWEYITKFDYEKFTQDPVDTELSTEEKRLVEYVEEFEKQMRDQYGQGQQEDESESYGSRVVDPEPKLFGYSMKDFPRQYAVIYILVIITLLSVGLYIAYNRLLQPQKTTYEKAREASIEKRNKRKNKAQ